MQQAGRIFAETLPYVLMGGFVWMQVINLIKELKQRKKSITQPTTPAPSQSIPPQAANSNKLTVKGTLACYKTDNGILGSMTLTGSDLLLPSKGDWVVWNGLDYVVVKIIHYMAPVNEFLVIDIFLEKAEKFK